jgi:hypothetical protein
MIITTTEELKLAFSAPNVNNDIAGIYSYLKQAESFIMPYISRDQWDALVAYYDDGNTPAEPNELLDKLLAAARIALVHYAYYLYADDGDMNISDKGFTRFETADEKTPYATQMRRFKRARLRDAWNGIHEMLMLLNANKEEFEEWATSAEYVEMKLSLIWNVNQFSRYRKIEGMRTLNAIGPSLRNIQEDIIKENIGEDLYLELLDECFEDDYSADNDKILPFIYKAIAHLSIANCIDENIIEFNENGASLISFEGATTGAGDKQNPADSSTLKYMKDEALKKGQAAVKQLRDYLNANASAEKYNAYFESDLYQDPNDTSISKTFTNKSGGTFFGV